MELDLGRVEEQPTDTVPGFRQMLEQTMPSLYEHTCSPGVRGGFFQRIERGTWAGHVIEHVAIELQQLIGHDVTYGKTITQKEPGVYHVVYRYKNEAVGLLAGEMALGIVQDLYRGQTTDITPLVAELHRRDAATRLGPSTQSIVTEAKRRGIPHLRLNEHSYVQLGQGKYQRRIVATLMDDTSALGTEIAASKGWTKQILEDHGIPVPRGQVVSSIDEAIEAAERLGYPVVIKPINGNHGRGISANLSRVEELIEAFDKAAQISRRVVIERYLVGFDYRLLVIDHRLVAAALREPAHVVGDGRSSIEELVDEINRHPHRGEGHEKILTRISWDSESDAVLKLQGKNQYDIPAEGEIVYVKQTANLSSGGTAIAVTDHVHPTIRDMAERISRLIGLNVMGIDLIAPAIDRPLEAGSAGVVEVNAGPGFRMHLSPCSGESVNVAAPVVDMLFPKGRPHSVPICAVTGTNGKTTTTRLIAHIMASAGYHVGMATTDGVKIGETIILRGDYSGPVAAQTILRDPTIDLAVLEVARGGILRRGLGFHKCDVGVLLNVTADHLGLGGIDTVEQLARVKSTVTETVRRDGWAVFNVDDPQTEQVMERSRAKRFLFSKDPEQPRLLENLERGLMNVTLLDDQVVIQRPEGNERVLAVSDIPITFSGRAMFNTENVLAAVASATALGADIETIRRGLRSFHPSPEQSAGRMNLIDLGSFKVLIDYGHNEAALKSLAEFLKQMKAKRIIRMAAGVGDRSDEAIYTFGLASAVPGDVFILTDPSPRGRVPGETPEIIKQAIVSRGVAPENVHIELREKQATELALGMAEAGDLVVLQVENVAQVTKDVLAFKQKLTS